MPPCLTIVSRRQFIQEVQSGATPITELCRAYGISRKTGYKCLARYEAGGPPVLSDRSRRPQHSPTATPWELVRVSPTVLAYSMPSPGSSRRPNR